MGLKAGEYGKIELKCHIACKFHGCWISRMAFLQILRTIHFVDGLIFASIDVMGQNGGGRGRVKGGERGRKEEGEEEGG